MLESQKLASVATRFPYLQGLLLVPIGLWMMLSSSLPAWWPWRNEFLAIPAALLAAVAYIRIQHFYAHDYGRVTPARSSRIMVVVATVAALAILGLALELDSRGLTDVSAFGLASALGFLAYSRWVIGTRWHHLVAASVVVAVSLLPAWTTHEPDEMFAIVGFAQGFMLTVAGVFDHAELVRSFDRARRSIRTAS